MRRQPQISVVRLDRSGIRKALGDLEAEVMELVWARDRGVTVRDVFAILQKQRSIAYTTVMTTMARLARKRLLRTETRGQAYVYFPRVTQDEFISGLVGQILENLLVSFSGATIERLSALLDPRAAARARQLLARIARRRSAEEDA